MPKETGFHEAFARALAGVSPSVVTLAETGSTNDDARRLARDGAPHGTVVVANHQTEGRGRRARAWVSPPGAGLHASWIIRPSMPVESWTLLPLLAGVAAAEAVRARTHVRAFLKWPNDILVGERKLGGILTEAEPPRFAVVGLGINVATTSFPPPLDGTATSIALEGGIRLDRADLLAAVMERFEVALADPEGSVERYRSMCATFGRRVRIERAGAADVTGFARAVDPSGALLVEADIGVVRVASGDVVHLRDDPDGAPLLDSRGMFKRVHNAFYWTKDMDVAVAFYRDVLGMDLRVRHAEDWTEFDAGNTTIALHGTRGAAPPQTGATVVFEVEDLDAAMRALSSRGVVFEGDVTEIPEGGRFSSFRDPGGNLLQIYEARR